MHINLNSPDGAKNRAWLGRNKGIVFSYKPERGQRQVNFLHASGSTVGVSVC